MLIFSMLGIFLIAVKLKDTTAFGMWLVYTLVVCGGILRHDDEEVDVSIKDMRFKATNKFHKKDETDVTIAKTSDTDK